jgi:hypothetical protein
VAAREKSVVGAKKGRRERSEAKGNVEGDTKWPVLNVKLRPTVSEVRIVLQE